jgi:SAM-dependent methyltransferase
VKPSAAREAQESRDAYDTWHRKVSGDEREGSTLHPWHETALRLIPDLDGCDVLEIGCGRGDFTIELARRFPGARIIGVDFSPAAIDVAKTRQRDATVSFSVADAQDLPFADGSFDWILTCECFEHVPSPARMARQMRRVLRPGGRFVLTTENYLNGMMLSWLNSSVTGRPFNSGSGVQPLEHFFVFPYVPVVLRRAGLTVTHMESNHFQWLLLPRVDPAKLCTPDIRNRFLKRLLLPFGRHFTCLGHRKADPA